MRFVVLGDTHIGALDNLFSNGTDYSLHGWKYALEYCRENAIKTLIQLGDIFDSPYPRDDQIQKFLSLLFKFSDVNVYCILGNHDYDAEHSSVDLSSWFCKVLGKGPKIYSSPTLEKIDGVPFFFSPYPFKKDSKKQAICIGHFDLPGTKRDNGTKVKGNIPKLKNQWILGHLHSCQEYKNAVYPGSSIQCNFGDVSNKYILECEVNKGKLEYHKVKLNTPIKLKTINIQTKKDLNFKIEENTYYKLVVHKSVKLPDSYLSDRPCIIKAPEHYSSKEQLEFLKSDSIENTIIEIDPFFCLDKWLKNKGLSKAQIKKALKIARKSIK